MSNRSRVPTVTAPSPGDVPPGGSSPALTPGTVLAGRYRVVAPLGRGGMGEVYRADDLKLGQPVALKFLPPGLAWDAARRARLLEEVRLAREVAHPNVCRVYDVGEADGQLFLTMEYVDGEDLASLLRRIGRLPTDKAKAVARQIASGLAAAHDRGVLHRDLKPANVMLDGRGRARITDFGLAVAADRGPEPGDASGTPLYMAPEQLAGERASVLSDVYALGLVLYEIFTGRRAFTDTSREDVPPVPSELISDMDPAVERVITRAMARDPRDRPPSAAHVAAALPGGNLLEAALRAGETPSPELVAASGGRAGLSPRTAWALVATVFAGAIAATSLGTQAMIWRRSALERSPEAMTERARETLSRLGYAERAVDHASAIETDLDYLRHLQARDRTRVSWDRVDPSLFRLWYRESPYPLESWRFLFTYGNLSRVSPQDPPLTLAGMSLLRLDARGRLVQLVVVPAPVEAGGDGAAAPDWPGILRAAGFDPAAWTSAPPSWTPPVYADARAAWTGTWPGRADLPVRIEGAAFRGRPVYFEVVFPWSRPARAVTSPLSAGERAGLAALLLILAAIATGATVLAQRNLRSGRGDRRGAFRLSVFVFVAMSVAWFFGESHVATVWEVGLAIMGLSWALFTAALSWTGYLAVEPLVRRRWPDVLVSWTRVLSGEVRDPLVGRDVLVGCAAGTVLSALGFLTILAPEWVGLAPSIMPADVIGIAHDVRTIIPVLAWRLPQSVVTGLAALFLLFLLGRALGSRGRAVAAFALLGGAAASLVSIGDPWAALLLSVPLNVLFALVLLRVGLLATAVSFYVTGLFVIFPITADLSAWYAGSGVTALLVLAALAAYGFTTAVARR